MPTYAAASRLALQSLGEFSGEQNIGKLALTVRLLGIKLLLLPVQVLKVNLSKEVGERGQVDHSAGGGLFQLIQQKIRQQEVAWRKTQTQSQYWKCHGWDVKISQILIKAPLLSVAKVLQPCQCKGY